MANSEGKVTEVKSFKGSFDPLLSKDFKKETEAEAGVAAYSRNPSPGETI